MQESQLRSLFPSQNCDVEASTYKLLKFFDYGYLGVASDFCTADVATQFISSMHSSIEVQIVITQCLEHSCKTFELDINLVKQMQLLNTDTAKLASKFTS